jgi:hypothetical protein
MQLADIYAAVRKGVGGGFALSDPACNELGLNAVLLEMYIIPVLGSGADADNHVINGASGNIHSFIYAAAERPPYSNGVPYGPSHYLLTYMQVQASVIMQMVRPHQLTLHLYFAGVAAPAFVVTSWSALLAMPAASCL